MVSKSVLQLENAFHHNIRNAVRQHHDSKTVYPDFFFKLNLILQIVIQFDLVGVRAELQFALLASF